MPGRFSKLRLNTKYTHNQKPMLRCLLLKNHRLSPSAMPALHYGLSRPQLSNLPSRLSGQPSYNCSLPAANHVYSSPPPYPRIVTTHQPSQAVKRKTTSRLQPACHSCFYGIKHITAQFHCSTLQCMGSFLTTPKRHAQMLILYPSKHSLPYSMFPLLLSLSGLRAHNLIRPLRL